MARGVAELERRDWALGGHSADQPLIHHLERDAEFLVELPKSVQILEIIDSTEN